MPPVFFRDGVGVAEVVGMVGGKGEAAGTCQHIPGICHGQKLVHRVGLRATTRGTTSLTTVMDQQDNGGKSCRSTAPSSMKTTLTVSTAVHKPAPHPPPRP